MLVVHKVAPERTNPDAWLRPLSGARNLRYLSSPCSARTSTVRKGKSRLRGCRSRTGKTPEGPEKVAHRLVELQASVERWMHVATAAVGLHHRPLLLRPKPGLHREVT